MTISKGAFGQSGKGAFIQSPMGNARGWAMPLIVYAGTIGGNAVIERLNPSDGSLLWSQPVDVKMGAICLTQSGRLYGRRNGSVAEFSTSNGSTLNSVSASALGNYYSAQVNAFIAAIGNTVVTRDSSDYIRLSADLATEDFSFASANSSSGGIITDADGNSYWTTPTSNNGGADRSRTKLNSAGSEQWVVNDDTTDPYLLHVGSGDAYGDYIFAYTTQTSFLGTNETWVQKISKSAGTVSNTYTISATDNALGDSCILRVRNDGKVYAPQARNSTVSVSLISNDLASLVATFDTGQSAQAVDILPGGDIILMGTGSTTWPGAAGVRANCWRLSADLSTVRWARNVGSSTYTGRQVACSYKPR